MNIKSLLAIFILGLMTGCSSNQPPPAEKAVETHAPNESRSTGNKVAVANEPCFHKGTMYSDGAASCQAGSQYRCSNGEWASLGVACTENVVTISRPCQFSGVTFPTGAASCQAGTQYRCEDGAWNSLGISCPGGDSPIRIISGGQTCMLEGGSTVATNSTVCRTGSTFLCSNGEWINLGTLCR
ncbi:MAG TPA: hypothetical protein VIE65_04840 [Methylobacter sp.]|jgi:hypothetical protein